MRSVTHQNPASLQLLRTLLDALAPGGEAGTGSEATAPPVEGKVAHPSVPTPPTKTLSGLSPGFNRPAPAAADALAAQMLGTLMAEGGVAARGLAELGGRDDGRRDSEAPDARREEPAPAQPKPETANSPIPWPTQALAAYSARPRDLAGLQPGTPPSRMGPGGGSEPGGAPLNPLKLFRRALACTCAIAAVVVLLNREALFG